MNCIDFYLRAYLYIDSNMPHIIVMCCVGHVLSDMFLYLKMSISNNFLYFEAFAFNISNIAYESLLLHMVAFLNFIV